MPLYRRPNSPYWWLRIGRKVRESTRTADRAQAEEYERVALARLWRQDALGDRGAIAWSVVAEEWLDDSPRAKERDRWLIDWLAPKMRNAMVREVDADALKVLRKHAEAAGWSHSTTDRMMGTVSAVLRYAVKAQYLERAPAVPMYRPAQGEPKALTLSEFERLCAHLPMHQILAAKFAVLSLLRMRAMLKLEWRRVDMANKRAWVPAAHQKAGRTFGFPLSDEMVRLLRALRWLSPPASPYVFTWNGRPIDDCNTESFQKAVRKAGLAPLRWHDLRHTGASWAVQNGVTLQELMMLGDWRDYRSVLRYAHLAPSQAARAADLVAHSVTQRSAARERHIAPNARKTG